MCSLLRGTGRQLPVLRTYPPGSVPKAARQLDSTAHRATSPAYPRPLNRLNLSGRTLIDMSTSGTDLARLADRASAAAIELARVVLEQDVADKTWAAQLGPALSQPDTARLLGKSEQAVSKDARLLRIRNRDDRPVYPIFQFDGRTQVPGVAEVIT